MCPAGPSVIGKISDLPLCNLGTLDPSKVAKHN